MLWFFAAVMLAVALVIVLIPLWRPARRSALDSNTANVELLKDQLQELDDELAAGKLVQEQYDAARADLEAAVAADLVADEARLRSLSKKNRQLLSVILLFVISSGSIGLYRQVTTYREVSPQHLVAQTADRGLSPIDRMIEVLAAELRENPDNAEGWQMLGRAYWMMEQIEEAVAAYAQAYELAGDQNPALLTDYAEAIMFAGDNRMQGRSLELVNRALTIAPGMPKALWLKGFASFRQGDYVMAISSWDKAVQSPELADEARQTLQAYIAEAHQRMRLTGEQGTAIPQVTNDAQRQEESAAEASIKVEVSLDDSVSGQADARETVFVFARAVSGPPMPLAVQKLAVADLPATVILDDSMAMLTGLNLSSQKQIVVGARVSRSGSPMPQTGDLQGLSGVLEPGKDAQVAVVISEALE